MYSHQHMHRHDGCPLDQCQNKLQYVRVAELIVSGATCYMKRLFNNFLQVNLCPFKDDGVKILHTKYCNTEWEIQKIQQSSTS